MPYPYKKSFTKTQFHLVSVGLWVRCSPGGCSRLHRLPALPLMRSTSRPVRGEGGKILMHAALHIGACLNIKVAESVHSPKESKYLITLNLLRQGAGHLLRASVLTASGHHGAHAQHSFPRPGTSADPPSPRQPLSLGPRSGVGRRLGLGCGRLTAEFAVSQPHCASSAEAHGGQALCCDADAGRFPKTGLSLEPGVLL